MTVERVMELCDGDSVYWNDPDGGICSRWYLLAQAPQWQIGYDDIVMIVDVDGSSLQCCASELALAIN